MCIRDRARAMKHDEQNERLPCAEPRVAAASPPPRRTSSGRWRRERIRWRDRWSGGRETAGGRRGHVDN
eukprot:5984915-Prymnesium_polylepis.1